MTSTEPAHCQKCERNSCRPEGYEPLCYRHYIESVKQAQKNAETRFRAHITQLWIENDPDDSKPLGKD